MNTFIKNNGLITAANRLKDNAYWIPTENEWYKAAYYDPTLNSESGGYWAYPTRSNIGPTAVSADSIGDGSAGNTGNFANYGRAADWNGQNGNVTSVGTNGGPSYYGTYDQGGNLKEWLDSDINVVISTNHLRGGSWESSSVNSLSREAYTFKGNTLHSEEDGFRIVSFANNLNLPNFVDVGDTNNTQDVYGFGSISYTYKISQYIVTNLEYTEFLNSVAKTDTYNLYNPAMGSDIRGGIIRGGSEGSYIYETKINMANKPVNYVNWFDCARYCNWLTNKKRSGPQNLNTTENGIYYINGAVSGSIFKKSIYI